MKFTAVLASCLAATAFAAPAEPSRSMATTTTWTFTSVKRVCNKADTSCAWSFGIKSTAGTQGCSYTVKNSGSTPASHSPEKGVRCGGYQVTSGWSGQFGAGKGFTTLSVVNVKDKTIAYPAYTDKELANGATVKPDRAYPVQRLS